MDKNKQRKEDIKDVVSKVQTKEIDANKLTTSDKVDRIIAHKYYGVLIFALIMFIVFTISQTWLGPVISDFVGTIIGYFASWVESGLESMGTSDFLKGFILEGIIGGFAAVVGFLPLIMVLFFLLNLLEDSGYMARIAIVMDRYFKKIGLAGKSIIPMYVGTACSIPAIMSARTIKNKRQRRMTVLLTPFVPCGAKLPVIALFVSVFFTGYSYITAIIYFMAIVIIFLAGYIIKAITYTDFENQEDTYLVIELPEYKLPSLSRAFRVMIDRGWEFVKKAATIIILMNALIWLFINFDFSFQLVENTSDSMLRFVSEPFAWLLIPLGFGVWGLAAAAIAGFVAKEEVVGALAVIFTFSVSNEFEVAGIEATRNILMTTGGLTAVSAFAYMAFNLFTPPCFAAIGAMNAELDSKKWTVFAVALQLLIGYVVALVIYQIGTIVFYQELGQGFFPSIIILIGFIGGFIYLKNLAKDGKGLAKIG